MKSKKRTGNKKRTTTSSTGRSSNNTSDDKYAYHPRMAEAMTPRQLLRKGLIRIVLPLVMAFGISRYQNYQATTTTAMDENNVDSDSSMSKQQQQQQEHEPPSWKRYLAEDWMIAPKNPESLTNHRITHVETFPNGATCHDEGVWEEANPQLFEGGSYRWYNELGQVVPSMDYLATNATRLYKGPERPGTHFVWPCTKEPRRVPGLANNVQITSLSAPPRIFHVSNFLTEQEMKDLKEYAISEQNPYRMARSTAGTHKSWEEREAQDNILTTRTSENAFDVSTKNSQTIRERAFQLLRLHSYNENMSDGIQIVRYQPGQAYIAHHDYFNVDTSTDHNWDPKNGGSNRWATVFLYLSDVSVGGQTMFPYTRAPDEQSKDYPDRSQLLDYLDQLGISPTSWEGEMVLDKCFSTKLSVRPKKGDALLFYSQTPDGILDPVSLHGACPVLGPHDEKWGANLWVWNACRFSLCENDALHPTDELPPSLQAPYTS